MKNNKVLIIGSGNIGQEYLKIFLELGMNVSILNRSKKISIQDKRAVVIEGDIFNLSISDLKDFSYFVVAVQPRKTFEIVTYLLKNTDSNILVEKPIALSSQEVCLLDEKIFNERIYVAFNRRNFKSTVLIKEMLAKSKLLSANISVTELSDRIVGHPDEIDKWGICNTIHMFDLVFYLIGLPVNYEIYRKEIGGIDFIQLFSFDEDHSLSIVSGGAGNWGAEFITVDKKFIMKPIETLKVQNINSVNFTEISLEQDQYKAGFLQQSKQFIEKDRNAFPKFAYYLELSYFIEKFYEY